MKRTQINELKEQIEKDTQLLKFMESNHRNTTMALARKISKNRNRVNELMAEVVKELTAHPDPFAYYCRHGIFPN